VASPFPLLEPGDGQKTRHSGSKSGSGRWSHWDEIGWVHYPEIGWSHSDEIRGVQSLEILQFGAAGLPNPIQWLSDNGCCYRAHETIDFAIRLGLVPCFTPVRRPQSNGMAEAFVKTFKRDYVYVHDRPDAQTVLSQLPAWFEDYNKSHPHKALRMKSPREFMRSYQPAACPV
jgi:transposase InsO family protein